MTAVEVDEFWGPLTATVPFVSSAELYVERGWWPLPLPELAKSTPPVGFTGSRSPEAPSIDRVASWMRVGEYMGKRRDGTVGMIRIGNVCVRMPTDVIGVDVDDGYEKEGVFKCGARTLAELESQLGMLPATYSSTARSGASRIRFYRVPAGTRLRAQPGDSIEIVQHHHRYAVVWPSVHPDTGTMYRWYDDAGEQLDGPPEIDELPELPWSWIEGLRAVGGSGESALPATPAAVQAFYDEHAELALPAWIEGVRTKVLDRPGSRHDRLVEAACWMAREAYAGCYPMLQAEQVLRTWWSAVIEDRRRLDGPEFDDAIAWAIAQVDPTSEQVRRAVTAVEARRRGAGEERDRLESLADLRSGVPDGTPDDEAEFGPVDPFEQFFEKGKGLRHRTLRDAVERLGPIAAGPGRSLWRYRADGVWLSDGDDEVRRRVSNLLGQGHRRSHAEGIVEDLRSREPFITDEPVTDWVNVPNGLLDWSTGSLHPHSSDVPSTYQLSVPWQPEAVCPTVDAWLLQVAPDDAIDLVWEVIGVSIYADMPVHRAVLLVGPGRNGKGTFLRLVQALIGRRYVSAVTLQALEERFAPADLFGKVANIAGDLDARSIKRTDTFKQATGGDLLRAEYKHGQPFTFTNHATMLFAANELPGSWDTSDGFFSRWVVVPFDRLRLGPGDEDPTIEQRLHAELAGVLVKAVEGLRRVRINGRFTLPASVAAAGSAYRDHADPIRRFADECLEVTGDGANRVQRSQVYAAYKRWCESNGGKPLGAARFYEHLATTFPTVRTDVKTTGVRYVTGVWLAADRGGF